MRFSNLQSFWAEPNHRTVAIDDAAAQSAVGPPSGAVKQLAVVPFGFGESLAGIKPFLHVAVKPAVLVSGHNFPAVYIQWLGMHPRVGLCVAREIHQPTARL